MMLGDKLHDYRIYRAMTLQEFADKLGLQPTVVDDWETHKVLPSVDDLVKIEQAFGIPVDVILSDKPLVPPAQQVPPVQPQTPPVQPQTPPVQQNPYAQQVPPVYAPPPVYGQPVRPVQPQVPPQAPPMYGQQPVYGQPPVYGQQPVYAQRPVYAQPVYQYARPVETKEPEKPVPGGLKAFSWITFGFSIAAIFIAVIIDSILLDYGINTMLVYYLSLIFPQSSIVAYIVLKAKGHSSVKNLVLGIVFTCLLILIIIGLSSGTVSVEGPSGPSL